MPQGLRDRPELWPHLRWVWDAFWRLGSDRYRGMSGAGPIPGVAIDRWADRHGVEPGDDYLRFERLISRMDSVILAHWAEEARERAAEAERNRRRT